MVIHKLSDEPSSREIVKSRIKTRSLWWWGRVWAKTIVFLRASPAAEFQITDMSCYLRQPTVVLGTAPELTINCICPSGNWRTWRLEYSIIILPNIISTQKENLCGFDYLLPIIQSDWAKDYQCSQKNNILLLQQTCVVK